MAITDPPPTTEVNRGDVFKQRRLLLSFTFALVAIHGLGVQLGNTISTQGLVLTFKPVTIICVLWICWAWAYWRYGQYERSFIDHALSNQRSELVRRHAEQAITAVLTEGIQRGDYRAQGFPETDKIRIMLGTGGPIRPTDGFEATQWQFPNLIVLETGVDYSNSAPKKASANCTLDENEVKKIRVIVERQLLMQHTSYADFKIPYWLAWLAPVAGLFALVRHFHFWGCCTLPF